MDASLKPMLCTPVDVVPEGPEWVLEPKLDGWRAIAQRTDSGIRFYSGRNGANYSGRLVDIETELLALEPGTVLDGELLGPTRGHVQSIMAANGPVRGDHGLGLVVFDVLQVGAVDVRTFAWEDRQALLGSIPFHAFRLVARIPTSEPSQAAYDVIVAAGGEGVVCKRRASRYRNTRSTDWVKIKHKATADGKVTGFKPGTGRWQGKVGAFEIQMVDSGARTTVKCGTDDRHEDASAHPEHWLDTVIEIEHNGIGGTGVPQNPRFLRRRDDLAPERPTRVAAAPRPAPAAGAWMRNYGAMGDGKLLKCIAELRAGAGDAVTRCEQNGGDVDQHLSAAVAVAEAKGLAA